MSTLRLLSTGFPNDTEALPVGAIGAVGRPPGVINFDWSLERIMPLKRVITHPALPQIVGQGIYEYASNPSLTLNFVDEISPKNRNTPVRTIGTTVVSTELVGAEDVLISEIWFGDQGEQVLSSMFRTFYKFLQTPLAVGQLIGWQPFDLPTKLRHNVRMIDVQLGSPSDIVYQEVRESLEARDPSYQGRLLTVIWKTERREIPPRASLSVEPL